jgi:hypothetical protein
MIEVLVPSRRHRQRQNTLTCRTFGIVAFACDDSGPYVIARQVPEMQAVCEEACMSPDLKTETPSDEARLDRRLSDIGWGLLFVLTGLIWMAPARQVPEGTWLFGVAAILIGVNVVRYLRHIAISGFSLVLGFLALLAALGQIWRVDLPLLAICLVVIGVSLVVKPLLTRAA